MKANSSTLKFSSSAASNELNTITTIPLTKNNGQGDTQTFDLATTTRQQIVCNRGH